METKMNSTLFYIIDMVHEDNYFYNNCYNDDNLPPHYIYFLRKQAKKTVEKFKKN